MDLTDKEHSDENNEIISLIENDDGSPATMQMFLPQLPEMKTVQLQSEVTNVEVCSTVRAYELVRGRQ